MQTITHVDLERSRWRTIEVPTILVAVAIYAGWIAVTWCHTFFPMPVLALLGAVLIAWHGSLQHETIHGHPSSNPIISAAIGAVPLSLWLPYAIYRRSHLAHHAPPYATDPGVDPESHYQVSATDWRYRLARIDATLVGRLVFGPPIRIAVFLIDEMRRLFAEPSRWMRDWFAHGVSALMVFWWLDYVGLASSSYCLAFVYPGTALTLLRSFAEHRADPDPISRAAIVRKSGLFGLLFLHNNLHAVHHARPHLAWFRLPSHYRSETQAYAAAPSYSSYWEVLRRYAFRAQDSVVHPRYLPTTGRS